MAASDNTPPSVGSFSSEVPTEYNPPSTAPTPAALSTVGETLAVVNAAPLAAAGARLAPPVNGAAKRPGTNAPPSSYAIAVLGNNFRDCLIMSRSSDTASSYVTSGDIDLIRAIISSANPRVAP